MCESTKTVLHPTAAPTAAGSKEEMWQEQVTVEHSRKLLGGKDDTRRRRTPTHAPTVSMDPMEEYNDGHSVSTDADNSRVHLNGKEYTLQGVEFHTPSEHTIGGKHMNAEMHMIHEAKDGSKAIIALLMDAEANSTTLSGDEKRAIEKFAAAMMSAATPRTGNADLKIPVKGWFSKTRTYAVVPLSFVGDMFFSYKGSLTEPPCTEGVEWLVAQHVIPIPVRPLKHLTEAILKGMQLTATTAKANTPNGGNSRPTRPLNGRDISISPVHLVQRMQSDIHVEDGQKTVLTSTLADTTVSMPDAEATLNKDRTDRLDDWEESTELEQLEPESKGALN